MEDRPAPKYKVGEPVLLAFCYGDILDNKYRWGYVRFAVVNEVAYAGYGNYLYTLVVEDKYLPYKPGYVVRGDGWITKIDEYLECLKIVEENCLEVEYIGDTK